MPVQIRFDFAPLRRRRRAMGISQGQLGEKAGMHYLTVYRIESNKTVPSMSRLYALSRALGVPAESLFEVIA
jgi:transcriptional regulator with XRE-family HTH domain